MIHFCEQRIHDKDDVNPRADETYMLVVRTLSGAAQTELQRTLFAILLSFSRQRMKTYLYTVTGLYVCTKPK